VKRCAAELLSLFAAAFHRFTRWAAEDDRTPRSLCQTEHLTIFVIQSDHRSTKAGVAASVWVRLSFDRSVFSGLPVQRSLYTLQSCNDAGCVCHPVPSQLGPPIGPGTHGVGAWHDCSADCESATSGPRHGPPTSTCRPSRSPQAHPPATALPPSSSVLTDFTRHYGPTTGRPFLLHSHTHQSSLFRAAPTERSPVAP
jgi:hypothetical protein